MRWHECSSINRYSTQGNKPYRTSPSEPPRWSCFSLFSPRCRRGESLLCDGVIRWHANRTVLEENKRGVSRTFLRMEGRRGAGGRKPPEYLKAATGPVRRGDGVTPTSTCESRQSDDFSVRGLGLEERRALTYHRGASWLCFFSRTGIPPGANSIRRQGRKR